MKNIKNFLEYSRDSKFGLSRLISSLLLFLVCTIKIINENSYQIVKIGAFILSIAIIYLIAKFLYEMVSKYSELKNISHQESFFRLLLTISFGTILIFNFPIIYQLIVASILIVLLFSRFVYK